MGFWGKAWTSVKTALRIAGELNKAGITHVKEVPKIEEAVSIAEKQIKKAAKKPKPH